jgi:ATP-binding protein involved in chromosome partitioning
MTMKIRTYHEVQEHESNLPDQMGEQQARVDARLASVGNVIGIMSGKGGVGKSLLSALLAVGLSKDGSRRVGVIDADLNGPSMPRFFGLQSCPLEETDDGTLPAVTSSGLRVISMSLLIKQDKALTWREPIDAGFVWRGAQERRALREFISDVVWGELDVLLVDLPPGTGRLAELHGLVPGMLGAIAVTIPSVASRDSVARSLHFAEHRGLNVLGLIENLSGVSCRECGASVPLYEGQAGSTLAKEFSVPLLGQIPFSPALAAAADDGSVEDWLDTGEELQAGIHELVGSVADICKRAEGDA